MEAEQSRELMVRPTKKWLKRWVEARRRLERKLHAERTKWTATHEARDHEDGATDPQYGTRPDEPARTHLHYPHHEHQEPKAFDQRASNEA